MSLFLFNSSSEIEIIYIAFVPHEFIPFQSLLLNRDYMSRICIS